MRRATIKTAFVSAALLCIAAAPAFAGYGALARDAETGKFGLSFDKPTQKEAESSAIKDCGGNSCKIVFRTRARQCGAIATPEKGKAWGASDRGNHKDAVELAAIKTCQTHTSDQCKVRASACNH